MNTQQVEGKIVTCMWSSVFKCDKCKQLIKIGEKVTLINVPSRSLQEHTRDCLGVSS